ncbi:helix-turn-helix transcriptional regulator [Streptococcus suis]|uniref:helix-turn-helix domain-containing protein n=1 Tax=Streptococcus suis TaxID=1307 RepID=UPI000CF3CCCC|nr:helix-turn-helix transcriptional regulator [Streptococcus suis]MBS8070929.1 helix-turn-helix transcriptional regulator [Streptococcus suis]MBS8094096.1 helix-turn-helix transcriptional regulator [Streptococcus suis]MBS8102678.1 helix-turn-helix transcriptional regulator [Streptococcus suis]MBY4978207.1 helix-turn-helix domain-containing protein [Streptococcus suis]MCK3975048.1 helix-turn-helix transcriptional regulator [Streptococcus suis]
MKWDFGTVLKEIRKSKGLSQQEVCGDALSRTTLSKIENNKEYPTIAHFSHILRQLDMTFAEFDYICHAYQPSERSSIIHRFENLRGLFFSESNCRDFLYQVEQYLKKHEDIRVQRIEKQLRLLLSILQVGDGQQTKQLAQELWQELEKSDTWYLADFRKLSLILPIFPVVHLENFVDKILLSLDKYKNFRDIHVSHLTFLYNLSTVLLRKEKYGLCHPVMERVYAMAQESMRIDYVGMANVRMGIFQQDREMVDKGLTILRAADLLEMVEQLEQEVEKYWEIFGSEEV